MYKKYTRYFHVTYGLHNALSPQLQAASPTLCLRRTPSGAPQPLETATSEHAVIPPSSILPSAHHGWNMEEPPARAERPAKSDAAPRSNRGCSFCPACRGGKGIRGTSQLPWALR